MRLPSLSDVGLHVLALILAIIVYHIVKNETPHTINTTHDRPLFTD